MGSRHSTRRRGARALLVAVAALGLLVSGAGSATADPADPADAPPTPPTITILSPTADAVVSGTVTVSAKIEQLQPPYDSDVWLRLGGASKKVSTFPRCQVTCTVSAAFDTVKAFGFPDDLDADGPGTVQVTVFGLNGAANVIATRTVVFDNQRPVLHVDLPAMTGDWGDGKYHLLSDQSLTLHATAEARADGATVAVWNGTPQTGTLWDAPTAPGEPWTLTLDTAASPEGERTLYLFAVDSRGVQSVPLVAPLTVQHGFTLTGPDLGTTISDGMVGTTLTYTSALQGVRPVRAVVSVDGSPISSTVYDEWETVGGQVNVDFGGRLPDGPHTLTFTVTDNHGVTKDLSYDVAIVRTFAVQWTTAPAADVVSGTAMPVAAAITSTAGGIQSWDLTIDGYTLNSYVNSTCLGDCPAELAASADVRWAEPGLHHLVLTVRPSQELEYTLATDLRVLPIARATLTSHAQVRYATTFTLRGTVRGNDGKPLAGLPSQLQRRVAGTSTWTTIARTTSSSTGAVSFPLRGYATSAYRVVTTGVAHRAGSGTGPSLTVAVGGTARISSAPSRIKRSQTIRVIGDVAPYEKGLTATLYYRWGIGWHTAKARVASNGRVVFLVKAGAQMPARYQFRILRPTTTKVRYGWSTIRTAHGS
ncbi:hypothetical protein [Angustibacter luteus]|uniref:Ig-like domain repeat protein n=1 Tax=Angustibacter luteus TaxID=658456 RepID=A0ABW1JGY0_9ACTN